MDDLQLLLDLHLRNPRQGPGSPDATKRALDLSGLLDQPSLAVADLGCGTGASTMVLAETLDAHITAVDLFPEFLDELRRRAQRRGVAERITTLAASIDDLPFEPQSLDAIWSEGAIYNIGFEPGLAYWRDFLKPGGVLAVSELTWLTAARPPELQTHWQQEYPAVDLTSAKIASIERAGFSPIGYFPLPPACWLDHYYRPIQARFDDFLAEHDHAEAALACVAAEEHEIDLYERHQAHISYGFYIAQRT